MSDIESGIRAVMAKVLQIAPQDILQTFHVKTLSLGIHSST